jgi:hypothetical protein
MQRPHRTFFVITAGDATLIGGDEHEGTGRVARLDGVAGAVYPNDLIGPMDITDIGIEDAVAVQENGGMERIAGATGRAGGSKAHASAKRLCECAEAWQVRRAMKQFSIRV